MKKHFSILTCLELVLKVFRILRSWCRARRGLLGAGKLTFWIFQALCSGRRARRGLLGAGNLTFLFFRPRDCVFWLMEAPRSALEAPRSALEAPRSALEAPRSFLGSLAMEFRVVINFDRENWGFFATVLKQVKFSFSFWGVGVRILEKTEVKMLPGSSPAARPLPGTLQGPFTNTVKTSQLALFGE